VCERSSQNGPWRFECSNFTSKNVIYVVHVLVKRSKTFKNPFSLFSSLYKFDLQWSVSNQGPHEPHLSTLTNRLQRHFPYLRKNLETIPKNIFPETSKIRRNSGNPEKKILVFKISEKSI